MSRPPVAGRGPRRVTGVYDYDLSPRQDNAVTCLLPEGPRGPVDLHNKLMTRETGGFLSSFLSPSPFCRVGNVCRPLSLSLLLLFPLIKK